MGFSSSQQPSETDRPKIRWTSSSEFSIILWKIPLLEHYSLLLPGSMHSTFLRPLGIHSSVIHTATGQLARDAGHLLPRISLVGHYSIQRMTHILKNISLSSTHWHQIKPIHYLFSKSCSGHSSPFKRLGWSTDLDLNFRGWWSLLHELKHGPNILHSVT